jgi:tetratricopeptide (TPR) repeat protein
LNSVIADKEVMALQNQMNAIHKKSFGNLIPDLQVSKSLKNIVYATAGIAVVMAITALFLVNGLGSGSADKLYAQYYKPASINMSFRSSGDRLNNDIRSAMTFYDNKKYTEAIQLFEKILKEDNSRIGLNLYSGIAHMEIKQYADANARFKTIIDQKANPFIESAEWYLGLSYLKTNDKDKAKEVFANLAGGGVYYKKDARRILKELK